MSGTPSLCTVVLPRCLCRSDSLSSGYATLRASSSPPCFRIARPPYRHQVSHYHITINHNTPLHNTPTTSTCKTATLEGCTECHASGSRGSNPSSRAKSSKNARMFSGSFQGCHCWLRSKTLKSGY